MSDPFTTSPEFKRMEPDWTLISDIIEGAPTVRRRAANYLPKYENESSEEYRRRCVSAPWRPEFTDVLRSLASKPFGKEVMLKGNAPDEIAGWLDPVLNKRIGGLIDDIDGQGNNLTTFARVAFEKAIAKGFHAIMVDYPITNPAATIADEKAAGARPYWVQIAAENILACYVDLEGGRQVITHVRIREDVVERDEYDEKTVERVRVIEPGRWELWERNAKGAVTLIDEGTLSHGGRTSIPMVLFFTGERLGTTAVRPPLIDLAHMQMELFRALCRQEEILTYAGSPMLAASGVAAPANGEKIEIGPKTVLFAPPSADGARTSFEFIQPHAANITEIRNHVAALQADMRRIGMQPLTEQPGNPTATGRAIDAAKAHSAVKAWALGLNDAIEQALVFTAEYLGVPASIETEVSTDFSVQPYAQAPLKSLAAARATKEISRKTFLEGLKRFDVLPQDFDQDADRKLLEAEGLEIETRDPAEGIEPVATETVRVQL